MNGAETNSLTWYITNYATKKQQRSSNISALLANSHAFRQKDKRSREALDANKRLIQGCANTLTREHEFAAPEIMNYLMDFGDRFESHSFVTIYWDAISRALQNRFPELYSDRPFTPDSTTTAVENIEPVDEGISGTVSLVDGVMTLRDQLKEYQFRGDAMESLSFLKFMVDTYEGKVLASDEREQEDTQDKATAGRPPNSRVAYRHGYGKPTRTRVYRTNGHEMLPRFVGKWFARKDDPSTREMFFASMLVIHKPWRTLSDLKSHFTSFEAAFTLFSHNMDKSVEIFIANASYYYEASDKAKARREEGYPNNEFIEFDDEIDDVEDQFIAQAEDDYMEIELTEADVDAARERRHDGKELLHAMNAMDIAENVGVFNV
ncbi:hypothetical protein BJ912DRAFT_1062309 [Pholiota molesta]|nr:hypothetical protein BJ912DRAFT_1062309 [Pholiota molesta]